MNQPVYKLQLGHVQGSVWINSTSAGVRYYSVLLHKSYTDNGIWKKTNNYNTNDLCAVTHVAQACLNYIVGNALQTDAPTQANMLTPEEPNAF